MSSSYLARAGDSLCPVRDLPVARGSESAAKFLSHLGRCQWDRNFSYPTLFEVSGIETLDRKLTTIFMNLEYISTSTGLPQRSAYESV